MVRARTAEKSARGGGSHIQTSENLFVETASAQQMKEDVEQTPGGTKAVEETQAGLGDKSGEEDKGS